MADRMAGRVLNGRYELLGVLGGGGMALVYRARDRALNRTVAVKVLREQYASDPNFLQRFTREAQAAGALCAPQYRRPSTMSARKRAALHRHGVRAGR